MTYRNDGAIIAGTGSVDLLHGVRGPARTSIHSSSARVGCIALKSQVRPRIDFNKRGRKEEVVGASKGMLMVEHIPRLQPEFNHLSAVLARQGRPIWRTIETTCRVLLVITSAFSVTA